MYPDSDPGGPKTYRSGYGSVTLNKRIPITSPEHGLLNYTLQKSHLWPQNCYREIKSTKVRGYKTFKKLVCLSSYYKMCAEYERFLLFTSDVQNKILQKERLVTRILDSHYYGLNAELDMGFGSSLNVSCNCNTSLFQSFLSYKQTYKFTVPVIIQTLVNVGKKNIS
jgi:hypothetical protein